ncbi:MAG: hypothetical protein ACE5EQ_05215 [Phycisphaerae bacterium]
MKLYRSRKWILLATMTLGSTLQLATCREDAALFGLRTAISSITLPINQAIRDFLLSLT